MKTLLALILTIASLATALADAEVVTVKARVISVVQDGVIAQCEPSVAWAKPGTNATGTIFVRGVTGLADGETLHARAEKTEEMFRYTTAAGAAATLRVYTYQSPITGG